MVIPDYIHQDWDPLRLQQLKPAEPAPHGQLFTPNPTPKKKPAKPRRGPKIPNYRFVLSFFFTRPVDVTLWKKIKAPPGWRKNPTNKDNQLKYCGVRFQCDDYKYALTPDEVETLRATLLMILEV